MSSSLPIMIRWGGKIIHTEYGVDYENGYLKQVLIHGGFNIQILFNNIRHVMNLRPHEKFIVQYRWPKFSLYGQPPRFGLMEISNNDDLNIMFGIINSLLGMLNYIELYIECIPEEISTQVFAEAGPSNSHCFDLNVSHLCGDGGEVGEGDGNGGEEGDGNEDEEGDEDEDEEGDGNEDGEDDEDEEGEREGEEIGEGAVNIEVNNDDDDDDDEDDDEDDNDEIDEEEEEEEDEEAVSEHPTMELNSFSPAFFPNLQHLRQCDVAALQGNQYNATNNAVGWNSGMSLEVGQVFPSRDAVKNAAKEYSMVNNTEFCSKETRKNTIVLRCQQWASGCKWSLRATLKKKHGMWEITKYSGEHTCQSRCSQGNRNLDTNYMYPIVEAMVRADPTIKIRVIIASLNERFKLKVTYRKAWMSKMKAIAHIYGDWDESYNHLKDWMYTAHIKNPGSAFQIEFVDHYFTGQYLADVKRF